jgi:transposase
MLKLTVEQKHILELDLRKAREASERNRLCVILGHNDGLSIAELGKVLRLSHATICGYLEDFDRNQKSKHDPRGGSASKLTEEQSQALSRHLSKTTYLKVRSICAYVQIEFGITYSRAGMTAWLQDHDFVFKRPKKVPGKIDPQQQERFIKKYQELKASLKPGDAIYFLDATHPEHQSQAACGWIKKGVQKTLQSTGKQLRLHIAGALCLDGMKIFTREYETVDAEAILDFLKHLEVFSKATKIHVILDNAKSNKNKKLDEFLAANSRLELHYLPPYSPNLNPIERLWKIMRENKLYNRYYESVGTFFHEVRSFFNEDIPNMTDILTSRITDNFQAIQLDPIRFQG